MKATIYLDDFTEENGATAAVKRSQLEADYPWDTEKFMERKVQGVGESEQGVEVEGEDQFHNKFRIDCGKWAYV